MIYLLSVPNYPSILFPRPKPLWHFLHSFESKPFHSLFFIPQFNLIQNSHLFSIYILKMHQFHRYDPAQPRTVTSFKGKCFCLIQMPFIVLSGNQKLIFEGYRYNIHHIVPAKGVKTWRCVCAKKLNGSRSWCKGRGLLEFW